jgi:hypothetical protein
MRADSIRARRLATVPYSDAGYYDRNVSFSRPSGSSCIAGRTIYGSTACRMCLHMPCVGFGTYRPLRQLRPYARTDAYR